MELALDVLVGLLVVAGLVGSLVPYVPGTPLILVAALVHGLATGFDPVGPWRLLMLAGLALLAQGLDFAAGALGARRLGGSGWGVAGAVVGALIGVFFGPLGLVLGPILGAVAGEAVRTGALDRSSLRSGLGAFVGMLLGVLAKAALAVVMAGLLTWWIVRG